MAVRKAKKKKKSRPSPLRKWIGWGVVLLFIVAACCMGYHHYRLTRKSPTHGIELPTKQPTLPKTAKPAPTVSSKKETKRQSNTFDTNNLELPHFKKGDWDQVVSYQNYTVCYSASLKLPLWVAYRLTKEEAMGGVKRRNNFKSDPALEGRSAEDSDYRRSGYDRGHLAPAADMAFSDRAMDDCFYFTNIAPQDRTFNGGSWKELEERVRRWARSRGELFVTTGVVAGRSDKTIGKNRVVVPQYFYKALLFVDGDSSGAIGFVFENRPIKGDPMRHAVSVDSVECLTGFDLFEKLPDSIENRIEATFNPARWQ